jgi:hypothetical protein
VQCQRVEKRHPFTTNKLLVVRNLEQPWLGQPVQLAGYGTARRGVCLQHAAARHPKNPRFYGMFVVDDSQPVVDSSPYPELCSPGASAMAYGLWGLCLRARAGNRRGHECGDRAGIGHD